jgi:hypothetical protein
MLWVCISPRKQTSCGLLSALIRHILRIISCLTFLIFYNGSFLSNITYKQWCDCVRPYEKWRIIGFVDIIISRFQLSRCLKSEFTATRLLELRVRIPPAAWISVSCECCVLSGRGLCVGMITHPEGYYRLWCVSVRSWSLDNDEALAYQGLFRHGKNESRHLFPMIS